MRRSICAVALVLCLSVCVLARNRCGCRYLYTANNAVSVIDIDSNSVVDTIVHGGDNGVAQNVAITPNGIYVYVTYYGLDTVDAISTATDTIIGTVIVGQSPNGIAASPNGQYVYVANYGTTDLSVISTFTNSVVATIAVGGTGEDVAVSPDGSKVYIASGAASPTQGGPGSLVTVDTTTNTVVNRITWSDGNPNGIWGVTLSNDGKFAYVSRPYEGVAVIDLVSNVVVNLIPIAHWIRLLQMSPSGDYLYVGGVPITVISTRTNSVVATFSSVGDSVAISPDGRILYNGGDGFEFLNARTGYIDGVLDVSANDLAIVPVEIACK